MRGAAVVEPRDCPMLSPRPTLSLRGCCGCVAPMGQPGFLAGWEPPPSLQAPTSELRPPARPGSAWGSTAGTRPAQDPLSGTSTLLPTPLRPSFKHLRQPQTAVMPKASSTPQLPQECPTLAKTALPHRALAPGASQAGETEADRAQQPPEPWQAAGGCLLPPGSLPRQLRPVRAGSGVGAAAAQGFPTLCSPPAPRAHSRHVISCSFFAPLIISAPVRHTARPCHPSPTSTRPQGADSSAGRFGSPQPRQRGGRRQCAG